MSRNIFQIENGVLAFSVVDVDAVGYDPDWQAPGGKTLATVLISDYEAESATWSCQVTSCSLQSTPSTTTTDVPATFCEAAETIPTPGKSTYELIGAFLQDPNLVNGLNRFLFEFDTEEAYFMLGLNGANPPMAIGRVRLASATIGGDARTSLTADLSMPLSRKPDIEFGDATTSEIVEGGEVAVTVATAAAAPAEAQPEPAMA